MPAVAAFGDILIALAAALLLWAGYQLFHDLLESLVRRIPFIGGELASLTDAVIAAMAQAAYAWAKDSVKALIGIILVPVHWISNLIDSAYNAIHALYSALSVLRYVTIPNLINQALSVAHGWFIQAEGYAGMLFTQAEGYSAVLFHQALTYTDAEIRQVTSYATTLYQDSVNFTSQEFALAESYAGTLYQDSILFTQHSVGTLESWTATSLAAVSTGLTADITALQKYITAVIPDVYAYVGTAVGAVELDLVRLKADCTDNLCTNLSPLASLLGNLAGDLGLAGLLALAAEAAHDPAGTGRLIGELFGTAANDAASVMRAAAGA